MWRVEQIGGTVRDHAARISELLGPARHRADGTRSHDRRALVVDGKGAIGLEERAELDPGRARSSPARRTAACCGTELELLRGEVDPAFVRYPLTLGHEWSGRSSRRSARA